MFNFLKTIKSNSGTIKLIVKRDFQEKYQGSILGLLWTILIPLIMLFVYSFVFSVIFKARWDVSNNESKGIFALVLFGNLILFNFLSETLATSTTCITNNPNLVKKVKFSLQLLPLCKAITAAVNQLTSIAIFLVALVCFGQVSWNLLLTPLLLPPLFFTALGLGYMIAAINVYFRDLNQLIGVAITLILFLSPIFYPLAAIPEKYQFLIKLNPLSYLLEEFRIVVFMQEQPNFLMLSIFYIVSIAIGYLGYKIFRKLQPSFGDVL